MRLVGDIQTMAGDRFFRYELRTTDVNLAREYYSDVLGSQICSHQMFAWDESGPNVGSMTSILSPEVHPQWLFFFAVANIEQSLERVREGGGLALRATRTPSGDIVVPCEDPQGAAFALYQGVPGL